MMKIFIMCGGSGTRLWPLSRDTLPKQFVPLFGYGKTLFQKTLKRSKEILENLGVDGEIGVIANKEHYFLIQQEAKDLHIPIHTYLLEDSPRDTAGAVILSALSVEPSEIVFVIPSDHIINDISLFSSSVKEAMNLSDQGKIVTFGITPTSPHTGYGYIHCVEKKVQGFFEKPQLAKAQEYFESNEYFWNSGMFCFKAQILLEECEKICPSILSQARDVYAKAEREYNYLWLEHMNEIEKISIDYALMEKTQKIAMVQGEFDWNDVGSFDSLKEEFIPDAQGNIATSEYYGRDSVDNFIIAKKPIVTIGVQDMTIIDTKDALLITKNGRTQEIKDIVNALRHSSHPSTLAHPLTYRPWGSYEVLEESANYKIKKIIILPQKRLSLQKHFHRNEHWIIVSGSALVRIGDEEIFLQKNQSTYIPMGTPHRLENPGQIDLVMIEVQVGDYVGEDDIVRIEDDYHRAEKWQNNMTKTKE